MSWYNTNNIQDGKNGWIKAQGRIKHEKNTGYWKIIEIKGLNGKHVTLLYGETNLNYNSLQVYEDQNSENLIMYGQKFETNQEIDFLYNKTTS